MASALTPEERVAIRARIVKLETAYDNIMAGTAIVELADQNGEKVRYNTANAPALLALINRLKAMLDQTFAKSYRPRPVGFIFPRQ